MSTTSTPPVPGGIRLLFAYAGALNVQPHLAVWVIYLTDFRDLSLGEVALLEGFFWASTMLLELPTGAFSDRFGRRTAFLVGTGIECAGAVAFGLAGDLTLLGVSYVLWAAGIAFRSGSAEACLYDMLAKEGAADSYPRLAGRMRAVMTVAVMGGGVAGSAVAAASTLQVAVLVAAAPYSVAMLAAWRMPEPTRSPGARPPSYLGTLAAAGRVLRDRPDVRWIIVFETAFSLSIVADFVFLQPFLEAHAVPLALFGLLAVPLKLSSVAGSVVSHRILGLLGLRTLLVATLTTALAGLAVLATVDHVAAFAGVGAIQLAVAAVGPATGGYVNDRTSSDARATVLSTGSLGTALVFAVSIPVFGAVADVDLRLAFGAIATTIVVLGGGALGLWHLADRATAPRSAAAGPGRGVPAGRAA